MVGSRGSSGVTRPIDAVLARLEGFKLRENGRGRWRACCPAHGGSNPSALSIGVGAEDQVLLRCWHGCDVSEVATALGLDLADLFPPRPTSGGPIRRRRLISASQALEVLDAEATLVAVCAADMARGESVDMDRLLTAAARIATLREECRA